MATHWDNLWVVVRDMGAERVKALDITLPPPKPFETIEDLQSGLEIRFEDLDAPEGGVLSYKGQQVLVYIPDQGESLAPVIKNPAAGKKYHVSHCATLVSMQAQNRNHRYVATNDTSGLFNLTNWTETEQARGALKVCKNCLKFLNYKDYSGPNTSRNHIFENFDLTEFFSIYSSLFKYQYAGAHTRSQRFSGSSVSNGGGSSWSIVGGPSICSQCHVTLASNVKLMGSGSGLGEDASRILCSDCLRKNHFRITKPVFSNEMRDITKERRSQGVLDAVGTWAEAIELADPAFAGLMSIYERQGRSVPEIGYPLTDSNGVVLEIDIPLAWEDKLLGVVASDADKVRCESLGWNVLTLHEALLDSGQDGY